MRFAPSPALICILAAWLTLGLATVLRPRPPQAREVRRGRGWAWGLVLQGLSIAIVWTWRDHEPPSLLVSAVAVLLASSSVAVMLACQRALGRQFAYQARLVEGHRLITTGPYRYVRNPIYAALFGLALATGLVVTRWQAIPLFAVLYAAGTVIRIRSEERLLRAGFGPEFDAYARRVPALIPLPWRKL
ncbi:MAG TPA: isoprenylcysteine carboxylmethyltransferase family protein [Bryobacteraceae bacterium]|nr:isoprenylcysteine carboxylmethyltransferase family protein [Bryobacteraceae bacterium]